MVRMVPVFGVALMVCLVGARTTSAQADSDRTDATICPAPSANAGRVAMRPFQEKRLSWFRRQYRLSGINYRAIKPLRDRTDASACGQIDQLLAEYGRHAPLSRSYYKVGPYYLVAVVDLTDPKVSPPLVGRLFVLDRHFRVFATIAPRLDL